MPDNMLGRAAGRFGDYLASDTTDFTPGAIGAGIGAGASALYTERQEGETPTRRAMRTVRNALIGGALGGTGGQLMGYGLGEVGGAVEAKRPVYDVKGPDAAALAAGGGGGGGDKGDGESNPWAPTIPKTLLGAGLGLRSWLKSKARLPEKFYKQYLGAEGLKGLTPAAGMTPALSRFNKYFPSKALNTFRAQFESLRGDNHGKVEAPHIARHLADVNKLSPATAKRLLRQHGIYEGAENLKGERWARFNQAVNPAALSPNRFFRNGGGLIRPGTKGLLGYFLPDIVQALTQPMGEAAWNKTFGNLKPGMPELGAVSPPASEVGVGDATWNNTRDLLGKILKGPKWIGSTAHAALNPLDTLEAMGGRSVGAPSAVDRNAK